MAGLMEGYGYGAGVGSFADSFMRAYNSGRDRSERRQAREDRKLERQEDLARQAMREQQIAQGLMSMIPGYANADPMQQQRLMQGMTPEVAQLAYQQNREDSQYQRALADEQRKRQQGMEDFKAQETFKAGLKPQTTDELREYLFSVQQGYKGSFQDWKTGMKRAGATSVNVNSGSEFGTIPTGHVLKRDAQGNPFLEALPGSPAALEAAQLAAKNAAGKASADKYRNVVVEDIDRITDMVNSATIPVTGAGSYLSGVRGTRASDVSLLLDAIRSNVGFDRLQEMRANSPTGGALGQVSDRENRLLQAALGSLEQAQSKEQFLRNLTRVKDIYLDIIHGPGNRPQIPQERPPLDSFRLAPQGKPSVTQAGASGRW